MISVFDMFFVGIGPSSSHTIGPMRAANHFIKKIEVKNLLHKVCKVNVDLYGSLALTGIGHGTDKALLAGLEGYTPDKISPDVMIERIKAIKKANRLFLGGSHKIPFTPDNIIYRHQERLPYHTNAITFTAYDTDENALCKHTYYSIGGGTIVENDQEPDEIVSKKESRVPYAFSTSKELLKICADNNLEIYEVMLENEKSLYSENEITEKLLAIADVMCETINRGCKETGILHGELGLRRRAAALYNKLKGRSPNPKKACGFCGCIDAEVTCYLSAWALAAAEENAGGGRIVVAPTCGSAGVLPAVLRYHEMFCDTSVSKQKITVKYLLTAAAIELIYKKQASISGAEVGCQGEIGVACSMAAAALTAVLGGDANRVEKAAEIGIEHHLGLTCDPVKGLVQIPCIERNVIAAVQAVSITHLVMSESSEHFVSLDQAIQTMKQTGFDMSSKYKETALGGLAVNVPNC